MVPIKEHGFHLHKSAIRVEDKTVIINCASCMLSLQLIVLGVNTCYYLEHSRTSTVYIMNDFVHVFFCRSH